MKKSFLIFTIISLAFTFVTLNASASIRFAPSLDFFNKQIAMNNPDPKDSEQSPIDAVKDLHVTGDPQDVDIETWRLQVKGSKVKNPLALKYQELEKMKMVKRKVTLVCPGVFTDHAEWEGVPLSIILEKAGVSNDYTKIGFRSIDGYSRSLRKDEIEENLIFLALKVNGVTLPKEHGYPLRLVAENITGSVWVKWIYEIEVD